MTPMHRNDRVTLDTLLADPLTQLIMRSDRVTPADVREAFSTARDGLSRQGETSARGHCYAAEVQDWFTPA